jgi:predicted nuclease of restriction endonuclease-like RecB superfamily
VTFIRSGPTEYRTNVGKTVLTTELLRVRRKNGQLQLQYLRGPVVDEAKTIAADFGDILSHSVGASREDIDSTLDAVPVTATLRVIAAGLRKLLEDRCTWDVPAGIDPETIRRDVFLAAAAAHRALDVRGEFDRMTVLTDVAGRLGTAPEAIDAALYADLRENERLVEFQPLPPETLIERYNLGLAQAALLRATRVVVHVSGDSPDAYRRLFRAARFHGLLYVVERTPDKGYVITLDGPFSLFDAVQKYGLRLAMFLPRVVAMRKWHVEAELLWGKERKLIALEITPKDGLVSHVADFPSSGPDLGVFCAAFEKLESEWTVRENRHIFAMPGEVVCIPDLVFVNKETGEEVFLEAFGFWSRDAVWQRVEVVRKGFPARILLAIGKHLRVSEEVLDENAAGELYVYRATMSPRAILERLRRKG